MPKKPPQPSMKGSESSDRPTRDENKLSTKGKQPAKDDDKRESSQPGSQPKRTDTGASSGSGGLSGLQRVASGFKGSQNKSSSSAATSEGDVKLFKSIKGTDGKVSPKKLLGVIFENMTITPAVRGRKFTGTTPKEQSGSPPSRPASSKASAISATGVIRSKASSRSAVGEDGGESLSEGSVNSPADGSNVAVHNLGFQDPRTKPEHLLWWFLPYDRDPGGQIAYWYDLERQEHRHHYASIEACRRELKEWIKDVKASNKKPGEKQDFTIVLYLEHKIEEYDDQVFQDVMASLDEILKQGNRLKIQVLVRFHDPSVDSEDDMLLTMNYVQVILMLLQDKYDEQGQAETDAIIARAMARRDSEDDRRRFSSDDGGSRSPHHSRDRGRHDRRTESEVSERDFRAQDRDDDRSRGRIGQVGRTGQVGHTGQLSSRQASMDSVGSGSVAPGVRQREERLESGREGFQDEFKGWDERKQR